MTAHRVRALLALSFALAGCGLPPAPTPDEPIANVVSVAGRTPNLADRRTLFSGVAESTPIRWNAETLIVSFAKLHDDALEIRRTSGELVASRAWGKHLGCAIVVGSTLHVFGTTPDQQALVESHSADLERWSDDVVVRRAARWQGLWNCSVVATDRDFVMTYEVTEPATHGEFTYRVARSSDLTAWSDVGRLFSRSYSACPTIRYVAETQTFYVLYLENPSPGTWSTFAVRTRDFVSYERSSAPVLEALDSEGTNASDVDLTDAGDGTTTLVYLTGHQNGDGDTRLASYDGTTRDFMERLFE
jgi:hypothetical protein